MEISFRTSKYDSKSYNIPLFLNKKHEDAVNEIIDHFEGLVGHSETEFEPNFVFDFFSDTKAGKGLLNVILKYFYNLKGLESNQKEIFQKYRLRLFQLMEKEKLTWVNETQQKELLFSLSKEISSSSSNNENIFFSDHSYNFKIKRKPDQEPKALEVINKYNEEIFKVLVSKSYYIDFILPNFSKFGLLIKNLVRMSKFLGIEIDIDKIKDQKTVKITLLGPHELVGRNIKYSNNLYQLLVKIRRQLIDANIENISLNVQLFESRKDVLLSLVEFLDLVQTEDQNSLVYEQFDSKIEEEFYIKFKTNYKHWEIEREPLIIDENIIMVPDFLLKYHKELFYLEIIGFWTEKYINKKYQKLNLLKNKYSNMILLVDKSLNFPKIEEYPTFYYGRNKIPILEIGNFLKEYEEKAFIDYYSSINSKNWKKSILEELESQNSLDESYLKNLISVLSEYDLIKVICKLFNDEFFNNKFINNEIIVILDPLIILKCFFLREFQLNMIELKKKKENLSFQDISNLYENFSEKVIRKLLFIIGYKFKFKSLIDETIVFPKKEIEIKPGIVK